MFPLISIITVVYNGEKYLEQTIHSINNQAYKYLEYIIIDGGSTDGTIDIIKKYENYISYWISEPDNGIYDAWNKALLHVKGEWVGFIGSDDLVLNDAYKNYADYIICNEENNLEFISSKILSVNNEFKDGFVLGKSWEWKNFKKKFVMAHVGALHNISLFKKYGNFDPKLKICGDYEFLLRAGADLKTGFIDTITITKRKGCSDSYKMITERFLVQKRYFGYFFAFRVFIKDSILFFFQSACNNFLRNILPNFLYLKIRKKWIAISSKILL